MLEVEVNEKTPMKFYGDKGEVLAFIRLCPNCARFVKADGSVLVNGLDQLSEEPNATCSKCGRVNMPFDGYWPSSEED